MKTIYGIICAFALFVMANACTPKDSFTIEGNIAGIPDGTVMTLTPGGTHQDEKTVAEATVADGKFSFDYAVESPRMFYIGQQGAGGVLPVVVENGTRVKLAGTVAYTGEDAQKWADFSKVQVSGSPVHDEYLAKMSFKSDLDKLYKGNGATPCRHLSPTGRSPWSRKSGIDRFPHADGGLRCFGTR